MSIRQPVKIKNDQIQGIIFFSCSFLKDFIKIIDVANTTIPPIIENIANTNSAFRTVNEKLFNLNQSDIKYLLFI